MKAFFREVFFTLLIAAVIVVGFQYTLQTFRIYMSSMEPSFHEGQRLLVNKTAYFFKEPERGDVIIFHAPNHSDDYIKRAIATPGDTVEIKDNAVYINGIALDEPYVMAEPNYTMTETVVPPGKYFVLGDNRNNSNDSHRGWFASREDIIGKAWLSTWPPESWGVVPEYPLAEQLTSSALESIFFMAGSHSGI
jgi:signal peptidase I